jgi:hypothetical protein
MSFYILLSFNTQVLLHICYGLDKCPPKVYVLEALSPQWCYQEVVEPLEVGLIGRSLGHWRCALEAYFGTPAPFSPISCSLLPNL